MLNRPTVLTGLTTLLLSGILSPPSAFAEKWVGRLAHDVVPVFQKVELTLDPDQPGYEGRVSIDLRVTTAAESFRLNAEGLEIRSTRLTTLTGGDVPIERKAETDDVLRLSASEAIAPGDYHLQVEFSAPFDTTAVSLYRLDYEGQAYAFTQFESDDAREAFPCFDEPIFKIPFQWIVRAPVGDTVITNTPVAREEVQDGWRTTTFSPTKPLPTYLLAVAVGPFDLVEVPDFPVPARIVTPRGKGNLAGTARDEMGPILEALERYFDRPYPYEKLDLLAVPEFWPGAMEHPGAITYRDALLLLDPETLTPGQVRALVRVTAHEFAHQWFGNLVTMEWWDDLWLNESFADWMGDRVADEVHPEMKFQERELASTQRVLRADARPSSKAIRRPILSGDSLLESVGVTYAKGKLVLSMFETWMGADAFREGVLNYLNDNEWGNATADDLWRALDASSGRPVSESMVGFLEQPGYPVVSVEQIGKNTIRLEQQRFRAEGVETADQSWDIPVVLSYFDGESVHDHSVLLKRGGTTVELRASGPIEWVYPNAGAGGYYRWSMSRELLTALAGAAASSLTPRERIEFLGNTGALVDAGQLAADGYLETLVGFAEDASPTVLSSTLAGLTRTQPILPDEPSREAFAVYVRSLLSPALDRFGLEPAEGEEDAVTAFRPQLLEMLGDWGEDAAIQAEGRRRTESYLQDPSAISPSLIGTWLALAAREGDAELWETFESRFRSSTVPRERGLYLSLLGSFRDPALRERALGFVLTESLQPQETTTIPRAVSRLGEEQADQVADWIMDHYEEIAARIPPPARSFLLRFGSGCSEVRWSRTREFFSREQNQVTGTSAQIRRVDDSVRECVRLREREAEALRRFLLEFAAAKRSDGGEARF